MSCTRRSVPAARRCRIEKKPIADRRPRLFVFGIDLRHAHRDAGPDYLEAVAMHSADPHRDAVFCFTNL
jgi:hypothetical protein